MPLDTAAPPAPADPYLHTATRLAEHGWCVTPDFTAPALTAALAVEARRGWRDGDFRAAGIGRADGLAIRPEIRGDHIQWLDPRDPGDAQRAYLDQIETLRQAINERLYLGLFDFEGHLAVYPPGSGYQRHLDRFQDVGQRTVSTVLYLNDDWQAGDGGQLRIYTDPHDPRAYQDVLPLGGRLVTFLSAEFEHEVRPAHRERLSLTGWFRTRG